MPNNLETKSSSKYKMDLLSLDWVHHGLGASDDLVQYSINIIIIIIVIGPSHQLILGFGKGQVKLFNASKSDSRWEFAVDRNYPRSGHTHNHAPNLLNYRILSVACSSSSPTFAVSAAGWHSQNPSGASGSKVTAGLTAPSLPSQMNKSNEMMVMSYKSSLSYNTALFDPTPGELSIWDINQQKIQVHYLFINFNFYFIIIFKQTVLPLTPAIAVNCMSFNHNSNLLVTGGVDGMIRLFGKERERERR